MADDEESNQRGDPELASRIHEAKEYCGRSQRQIALDVGVTAQSATKWFKWGYIDKSNIPAFCRATGTSIEWFLTGEGDIADGNPLKDATVEQVIRALQNLPEEVIGEALQQLGATFQKRRRKPK